MLAKWNYIYENELLMNGINIYDGIGGGYRSYTVSLLRSCAINALSMTTKGYVYPVIEKLFRQHRCMLSFFRAPKTWSAAAMSGARI